MEKLEELRRGEEKKRGGSSGGKFGEKKSEKVKENGEVMKGDKG